MSSMFTNLKRASPSISENEDMCFSSSESLIRGEDDLILPPVSSFMKTCRPVQTILPSVATLSEPEVPVLPSLHELHLLPERRSAAQPTTVAATTTTTTTTTPTEIPFTVPTSIVTTPIEESKLSRPRKQYKRRPAAPTATLAFSNSTTNSIITTPSLVNRGKSFNLFDKSIEASVEGFGRAKPCLGDSQKSTLDLLLLGEAAAFVEKEEGGAKRPQMYAQEQDVSMSSSLVPSNAGTPQPQQQPQMPILTLPHAPATATTVAPPITVPVKSAVVSSPPRKDQEARCAPKIRIFENGAEQGGMKHAADGAFNAGQEPRARRRSSAINKDSLYCHFCGRRNTPEWRKGPDGPATLCNACGLQWAKRQKMINNTKNIGCKNKTLTGSSSITSALYNMGGPIQPTLKPISIEPITQLPQTPLENTQITATYTTAAAAAAAAIAASSNTVAAPVVIPPRFPTSPAPATRTHFVSPAPPAPFQQPAAAAAPRAPYGGFQPHQQHQLQHQLQLQPQPQLQVPPALPQRGFCDAAVPTSPEASLQSKLAVLNALSASVGINMNGSAQRLHHGHHRSALAHSGQQGRALSPQEFASTLSTLSNIASGLPRSTALSEELQHTGSLSNNVVVANKISNGSSPLK